MRIFFSRIYNINRLSILILHDKSSIEVLFGVKPNYNFLRVFSWLCFPCLRPCDHHKLEACFLYCSFLGNSPRQKVYKCLFDSRRLYLSSNVFFDEHSYTIVLVVLTFSKSTSVVPTTTSLYSSMQFFIVYNASFYVSNS